MDTEPMQHHTDGESLMDRSGMGLLPGLGLAFILGVAIIGAILVEAWWVVPLIALALFLLTAIVVAVVLAAMDDSEDRHLRRHIPGL